MIKHSPENIIQLFPLHQYDLADISFNVNSLQPLSHGVLCKTHDHLNPLYSSVI